ncbi:DUF3152 domain-containing protein [Haloglycomyces albus]|uniref:DUF3152 domain-containing protein n=1 Tax=Haloglycomyces albus TaxID=526067 RepID=UPI00046D0D8B|nr:DUF3152 domain-containing protein [Haloglycomyces albus]
MAQPSSGNHRKGKGKRRAERTSRAGLTALVVTVCTFVGGAIAYGELSDDQESTSLDETAKTELEADTSSEPDPVEVDEPDPEETPEPTPLYYEGDGTFRYTEGTGQTWGEGSNHYRFNIAVEEGTELDLDEFTETAVNTLSDERSWIAGDVSFELVGEDDQADFTLYLVSPHQRSVLCESQDVSVSCRNGDAVVINAARWLNAVEHWETDLESYRKYVINHEVGHRLGYGHEVCGEDDTPSPVMAQQTYQLGGCEENAWPYPNGEEYLSGPPGEYGGPRLPADSYDD